MTAGKTYERQSPAPKIGNESGRPIDETNQTHDINQGNRWKGKQEGKSTCREAYQSKYSCGEPWQIKWNRNRIRNNQTDQTSNS